MKEKGSQAGWGFWLGWVLASTVGWFVGFIIGFILLAIVGDIVGEDNGMNVLGLILGAFIFGASLGSMVGILQWLVLRRRVSRAGWWVLASTAGFIVGWGGVEVAMYMAFGFPEEMGGMSSFTNVLGQAVVPALGGAVMGTLQWLILRGKVSRAGWWVLASTVGWALGVTVAEIIPWGVEEMEILSSLVVTGTVLGAVTGAALVWLLRQPVPEAQLEG